MKSRNGNYLFGARISEKVELDTIQLTDPDTKQTTSVGVRFVEEVDDGVFSELDIIAINQAETIVYTWAPEKPKPLRTKA